MLRQMTRSLAVCLLSAAIGLAAFAPAALGAPPNPAVNLTALSCGSTGNCSAVGTYEDALGDSQGLLVTESHGRWNRAAEAQPPAGAAVDPFKSTNGGAIVDVSCPQAGSCVAIGRYTGAGGVDHGVFFTERDGVWQRGTGVRLPSNAVHPGKPKSGVIDQMGLAAIRCGSVGNCVAVGNYETNAEIWEAMIITERHGRWQRAIAAPLPAGAPVAGQDAVLLDVVCPGGGTCTASGYYVDARGHQQALLVRGSGSDWSAAPAPAAPLDASNDPNIAPSAVSCATATTCAAVGTYVNPLRNSLGLLFSESAGSWQQGIGVSLPADAAPATTVGDQTVVLSSVSCPLAGSCIAVGWYFDNDENGQGLIVGQQQGSWQPGVAVKLPANAVTGLEKQSAGLDWVSCESVGNCLATGVYTDAGYNSRGLLLSEVNGVWQTGLESPLPHDAGNVEYAYAAQSACTGPADCAVIGTYNDTHGDVLGYTISESAGGWGAARQVTLPPVANAEVKLSLSALLAPYGKAGTLAQVRKARGYVFNYAAAEAGGVTVSWYASAHGRPLLIGHGAAHVNAAGSYAVRLKLSNAGRSLLANAEHLRVRVTTRFAPGGHHAVQRASGTFTLH